MLTIQGPRQPLCEGISRRAFLGMATLGTLGIVESSLPKVQATSPQARRCLLLFLTGGPPQHDTWDPKPEAPAEIRGELQSIATAVPGVRVSELFPRLARRLNRCCLIRSVTHTDTVHTSAGYTMLSGVPHPLANSPTASLIRPTANDHPHFGSLLSRMRPSPPGIPTFVALPEVIRDAGVNEFPGLGGGLLGRVYDPFRIEGDPQTNAFRPPEILLPDDVTAARLNDRRLLLDQIEGLLRRQDTEPLPTERLGYYSQAFEMLRSPQVRSAFLLDREPDRVHQAYGGNLFGQGCLLGRRLLEAGVSLVSVYWHYEGPEDSPVWDTHWNNFRHLRERLAPPADRACAALLDDLVDRGLFEDTLLIVMGEFGRTPRVNGKAGRDHWPHVQTILVAGAGIPQAAVYGASDRQGAFPADRPVSPSDLVATILHLLGVQGDVELVDRTGRPVRACTGVVLPDFLGRS